MLSVVIDREFKPAHGLVLLDGVTGTFSIEGAEYLPLRRLQED
jgi:hypothetical protein